MSFLNCKSQIIIERGIKNNVPKNFKSTGQYYYKDVHNYLDKFVGTWEYVNGNEKFQIILTKIVKYHYVEPIIELDYYEDGIHLQYKKFVNGSLVFQSPITNEVHLSIEDPNNLKGHIYDYGRQTVEVVRPAFFGGGVEYAGGQYFHPQCDIEKLMTIIGEPQKIKFKLYNGGHSFSFGSPYDNPAYNGLPQFSIPNDIVLTKVP